MVDYAVLAATIIVPIVLVVIFRKAMFRKLDNAIVDGAAATIKGKRKASEI